VLAGTVDTNGQAGTVHFELTPARGGATIATPDQTLAPAAGPRRVRARVDGLRGSTAYRATIVVTTAGGTSRGDAGSFTTPRDRARPSVAIRSLTPVRMARRAAITPRVVCNEPCSIRAVARVGTRPGGRFRPLAGARVAVRLTPVDGTRAADTDVRIDLTRARRLVVGAFDARRRVVVRLEIRATDVSGNRRVAVRFIPVRRR